MDAAIADAGNENVISQMVKNVRGTSRAPIVAQPYTQTNIQLKRNE